MARLLCLSLLSAVLLLFSGCPEGPKEETRIFQEAEACYSDGDYDNAVQRYEAFLSAYPRSPLARTAELRLRTIEREIDSVMGSRGGNRPVYKRPDVPSTLDKTQKADPPPKDEEKPTQP